MPLRKQNGRRVRVGVLGCGPIAQYAHFESCIKARNADLYAICDVAQDLLHRMAASYQPQKSYQDYDEMLADPDIDAVIIATSDAFHVPASMKRLLKLVNMSSVKSLLAFPLKRLRLLPKWLRKVANSYKWGT
ncbi:MAG: Gfo/Idh/MocA family oxidoreductase [Deinococcales bacterium]